MYNNNIAIYIAKVYPVSAIRTTLPTKGHAFISIFTSWRGGFLLAIQALEQTTLSLQQCLQRHCSTFYSITSYYTVYVIPYLLYFHLVNFCAQNCVKQFLYETDCTEVVLHEFTYQSTLWYMCNDRLCSLWVEIFVGVIFVTCCFSHGNCKNWKPSLPHSPVFHDIIICTVSDDMI